MDNNILPSSVKYTEYILVPEFVSYPSFFNFFIVLTIFLLSMVFYVYSVNYNISYTPNLSMFIDFFTERTTVSQKRFENYIYDVARHPPTQEGFNNNIAIEPTNSNLPIFKKIRHYINSFITNTFYVKGNTIWVKA